MLESKFINDFYKKLKIDFPEIFWYKINDAYNTGLKPFDVTACWQNLHMAIEFKKHEKFAKKNTTFHISKMEPHQITYLEQAQENGCWSIVICRFKGYKTIWWPVDVIRDYWDRGENLPIDVGHEWNNKVMKEKQKEYAHPRFCK